MENRKDIINAKFAITARTLGHPRKLYTPITVMNLEGRVAAKVNAMWDTGAEYCIMSESLAQNLHINFKKEVGAAGLTGNARAEVGYAYVALVSRGGIIPVITAVVADHVGGADYSFIVGLNLISLGSLSISHFCIDTVLSFKIPSGNHIDYVAEADGETPRQYLPLSNGKEDIRLYYDNDALSLMSDAVPNSILKNYLGEEK